MIPNWSEIGTLDNAATTQMMRMIFIARGKPVIVCAFNGWQIAMYLSIVKAVIVRTDAYEHASDMSARRIQKVSPKTYGYFCQKAQSSWGRPTINRSRSETARENR